ncbi:MAG: DUF885 domain-containing protein [Bdellovibrionaceae bacterium]|nr:DUF885 domain-containing protein [Pseudobdellovibrionaceae bacterium]
MDQAREAAKKFKPTSYEKKCSALTKAGGNESKRLQKIFDLQWNYVMVTFPEWATSVGFPGQDDRLTDNSFDGAAIRDKEQLCTLKLVKSISRHKLNTTDQLNYDLFLDRVISDVEGAKYPDEYFQITQLNGIHQKLAGLFDNIPAKNENDYKNIIARLKGGAKVMDNGIAFLKEGFTKKITPPKITLRDVPDQVQAMIKDNALESPVLLPFKTMPESMNKEKAEAFKKEAIEIYNKELKPRYIELKKYLVETYIPGTRESIGMKDLPDGINWYNYRLKQTTTTDMTARQIHDLGLKEVARIDAEMKQLVKAIKFKGSYEDFQDFIKSDKQFFYKNPEDLLAGYRDIAKRIDPELIKLFGKLPRLPYGILPVPAYSEKSQTTAYYNDGSIASGRAGYFYANTYDLKSRPKWEMEALTLHEAVPGHHLQISLASEMENVPEFRKYGFYTAYVEGWGLYAESLGDELGLYKDPYQKYGQLTYEMWRALRLVVDTGIHALGWEREQSIKYMMNYISKPQHDIVVEVDRYIVWPGQATAYKIGELKLKELRHKATQELNDKFDVRKFHDLVLAQGALPLGVLEKNVNEYIKTELKKNSLKPLKLKTE